MTALRLLWIFIRSKAPFILDLLQLFLFYLWWSLGGFLLLRIHELLFSSSSINFSLGYLQTGSSEATFPYLRCLLYQMSLIITYWEYSCLQCTLPFIQEYWACRYDFRSSWQGLIPLNVSSRTRTLHDFLPLHNASTCSSTSLEHPT